MARKKRKGMGWIGEKEKAKGGKGGAREEAEETNIQRILLLVKKKRGKGSTGENTPKKGGKGNLMTPRKRCTAFREKEGGTIILRGGPLAYWKKGGGEKRETIKNKKGCPSLI